MFSKACEYAIRASVFIASKSFDDIRVNQTEIAKNIDSPKAFTAKILQALVRAKVITSVKGVNGGFEIEKSKISAIKLSQIVQAIDGDDIYKKCGFGLEKCDENHQCPVHHKFKVIRDGLREMLENTSLDELALDIKSGTSFLKI
jgi:Rrf2 family protein